ncbi:Innexin [Cinara cedri]|uniref:Innexin n=1 Tax=Cinara cedri TaxID=506608 RepID=A0A5E4MI47_9HEMI|nr:Innexin [Cinara cedri]
MTYISLFNNIVKSFKVHVDKPVIDDFIFRCHYKLTTNILFMFCILITSINLIGKPIECITNLSKNDEVQKVINTYCLISSLYTYENKLDFRQTNERNIRFHSYYQWVPFMFFLQAVTFYVPHWIWKMWEGGKIRMLTEDMRGFYVDTVKDRLAKQSRLAQYFVESIHTHSTYAYGYVACEVYNAVNVIANIYVTNKFLGASFMTYGTDVLEHYRNRDDRPVNPMDAVFPRLTKCDFFKYGPSGTVQNVDAMCVLGQNVLNDKLYLFLWVWFFGLAAVSAVGLLYRFAVIVQTAANTTAAPFGRPFEFANSNKKCTSALLMAKFRMGDSMLFAFVRKNVNGIQFEEIAEEICSRLDDGKTSEPGSHCHGYVDGPELGRALSIPV